LKAGSSAVMFFKIVITVEKVWRLRILILAVIFTANQHVVEIILRHIAGSQMLIEKGRYLMGNYEGTKDVIRIPFEIVV
jgi:hypothetical protein